MATTYTLKRKMFVANMRVLPAAQSVKNAGIVAQRTGQNVKTVLNNNTNALNAANPNINMQSRTNQVKGELAKNNINNTNFLGSMFGGKNFKAVNSGYNANGQKLTTGQKVGEALKGTGKALGTTALAGGGLIYGGVKLAEHHVDNMGEQVS